MNINYSYESGQLAASRASKYFLEVLMMEILMIEVLGCILITPVNSYLIDSS